MKGYLLSFNVSESKGVILAEDGNRYTFHGSEWKDQVPPQKGMNLDFLASQNDASEVYIDPLFPMNKKEHDWYKSSDDKALAGVCSGLAHKFDVSILGLRVVTLISSIFFFFPFVFYIVLWLLLPSKKTIANKPLHPAESSCAAKNSW